MNAILGAGFATGLRIYDGGSAGGSVQGEILGGQFTANTDAVYLQGASNFTVEGDPVFATTLTTGGSPIVATGADAVGTFRVDGMASTPSAVTPTSANFESWQNESGASVTFSGQFVRNLTASAVPSTYAGSLGDLILNLDPSASVPVGWTCTTAGTPCSVWTPH